jgi:diguanylate cyclase (GGDEF)-like protein
MTLGILICVYGITRWSLYTKGVHEHLTQLSTIDDLTGVRNRRSYNDTLIRELQRATRYKTPMSIMLIDLDFFKQVNDEHGHCSGDIVLIEFAKEASRLIRQIDSIARYGGEEFAVIMPNTSISDAVILAERLRQSVERKVYQLQNDIGLTVTVSIGVAQSEQDDDLFSITDRADRGLYRAKSEGRNTVREFS